MMALEDQSIDQESETPFVAKFARDFPLSCFAATVAEYSTYPLDIVKTRMQIHGENGALATRHHLGNVITSRPISSPCHTVTDCQRTSVNRIYVYFSVVNQIVKQEGFAKLWKGVTPAACRHLFYTGIRVPCYEVMRDNVFKRKHGESLLLWQFAISGSASGFIGQFVASPFDLVKVLLQTDGMRAAVDPASPKISNMNQAFRVVLSKNGFVGLWRGWAPNCYRGAIVNAVDIVTYDYVKHWLIKRCDLKDGALLHGISAICSSFVCSIVSTPVDVVKTRMMNQIVEDSTKPPYTGTLDCLIKTYKNEQFMALYKGFLPICIRMMMWSPVFWISYEWFRNIVGMESF